ncbi:uncharacterized protein LOC143195115 [Rhynchophorus ferrugineus]|uniref:uncharacterized protein LOC143195115 n=1 Tax=Rhynchophorus ferrugineus TaxID=354439 RepID=UPI003FCD6D24
MAYHVSCPACQQIFFNVLNMSGSTCNKNLMSKSQLAEKNAKKSHSPELEKLLLENDRIEKENKNLRDEISRMNKKNEDLTKQLTITRTKFYEDFDKLQEQLKLNEKQLLDGSKKCLAQQKKYSEEIRKLKQENESLNKHQQNEKLSGFEKIKILDSENKLLKLENESLKAQNEDNNQKTLKYKMKLKHAVKIVNELNNLVTHYHNKPEINCGTTQTDNAYLHISDKPLDCSQCRDTLNAESLLLSDIFFKTKSFGDGEIELFSIKSKSKY